MNNQLHSILAIISLLFTKQLNGQTAANKAPDLEFRINLETVMYQKLLQTSEPKGGSFNSRDAPSGVLSLSAYSRLKHGFAIEPGVGFTIIPYHFNYDVKLSPDHPLYASYDGRVSSGSYTYGLYSTRLSLSVLKEFSLHTKQTFFAGIGAHFNIFPTYELSSGSTYGYINTNNDTLEMRFFGMELLDPMNQRGYFWGNFSYAARFGFIKTNSKGNGFNVSLVVNIQPREVGSGNYTFNQGSYLETGTLRWTGSYYGFCFSKSFNKD